ncbi:MAG: hypothetical protein WC246_00565 [Candidatus Paceibacterota bacterium]
MNGISPAKIPQLINGDVDLVSREAQYVLILYKEDGIYDVTLKRNPDGKLSIIAVIGEGTFQGVRYPLALLCEIGLRRGKPYQAPYARDASGKLILWRRTWFTLTFDQYRAVAPHILSILQGITDETSRAWLFGNRKAPRTVFLSVQRWNRKKRSAETVSKKVAYINGVRFSVLPKEEFLIKDLYWAEAHLNQDIARITEGLAYFIGQSLGPYMKRRPNRKDFFSLRRTKRIKEKLLSSSLPLHLKMKLLKDFFSHHPDPRWATHPHPYWDELRSILQWDGESMPPECELIEVQAGDDPSIRLGNIQTRILQRPNGYKYFVFEVYERPE